MILTQHLFLPLLLLVHLLILNDHPQIWSLNNSTLGLNLHQLFQSVLFHRLHPHVHQPLVQTLQPLVQLHPLIIHHPVPQHLLPKSNEDNVVKWQKDLY
ncbi:hypothetical protein RirG_002620 [Rhizophagus irregularis DAOM 197198w]|uniref:Uncharacterized protein n=1 Tax=Rhizophagus irregularis (strain DAOM 197198w) TaxID=1432141 RepID=A0A015KJF0_RHIIW|nr:hypothetical protein RirG_002620 [Rhizophagus irregularis DAOM 197198w]